MTHLERHRRLQRDERRLEDESDEETGDDGEAFLRGGAGVLVHQDHDACCSGEGKKKSQLAESRMAGTMKARRTGR